MKRQIKNMVKKLPYKIQLFNTFLELVHDDKDKITMQMPLIMKNLGGSIWLKKIEA